MKKILLWLMVVVFIISMTSLGIGCKATTAGITAAETTAAETTAAETTAAAEELGVKPPESPVKITLVSWSLINPTDTEWEPRYQKFREKYPTIEIEVTQPLYADHVTLLKTGFAAGAGPDLFGAQVGGMMFAFSSFAEPLDSYCIQEWGENWQDKFVSSALDQVHWVSKQTLGLPDTINCLGGMWYNKTLFDKLNLEVPKTYDELLKVADILRSNGYTPVGHAGAEGWANVDLFMDICTQISGDKLWKADAGEISWTDPDLVASMEMFQKFFKDNLFGKDPFTGVTFWDKINPFMEGKTGMYDYGCGLTSPALALVLYGKQDPNTVFRPMEVPDLNNDGEYSKGVSVAQLIWMINKNTDEAKKRAAFIVIKEMIDGDGIFNEFHRNKLFFNSFLSAKPDPKLFTPAQLEVYNFWIPKIESAVGSREFKYQEITEVVRDNLNEVAIGNETPIEALGAIQKVSDTMERPY